MSLYDPDLEVGSVLEHVLTLIGSERRHQDLLKAQGRFSYTCADDGMTDWERLGCILEEVAEVNKILLNRIDPTKLDHDYPNLTRAQQQLEISDEALRKELTQIAALAAAWMERFVR